MNLIEALRTGLPLRRPIAKHWGSHKTGWLDSQYVEGLLCPSPDIFTWPCSGNKILTVSDVMADDWEVRQDPPNPRAQIEKLVPGVNDVIPADKAHKLIADELLRLHDEIKDYRKTLDFYSAVWPEHDSSAYTSRARETLDKYKS